MKVWYISYKIKSNLIIFLLSIFLAFSFFYINNNKSLFQASILSLQDINLINQKKRDIAYKNGNWLIDIFVSQNFLNQWYESLNLSIIFKDLNLSQNIKITEFQKEYKIDVSENKVSLSFIELKDIKYEESLIVISFSWSVEDALISEVFASKKWNSLPLFVGNLTQIQEHKN